MDQVMPAIGAPDLHTREDLFRALAEAVIPVEDYDAVSLGFQDAEEGIGDRITVKVGDDVPLSVADERPVGLDGKRDAVVIRPKDVQGAVPLGRDRQGRQDGIHHLRLGKNPYLRDVARRADNERAGRGKRFIDRETFFFEHPPQGGWQGMPLVVQQNNILVDQAVGRLFYLEVRVDGHRGVSAEFQVEVFLHRIESGRFKHGSHKLPGVRRRFGYNPDRWLLFLDQRLDQGRYGVFAVHQDTAAIHGGVHGIALGVEGQGECGRMECKRLAHLAFRGHDPVPDAFYLPKGLLFVIRSRRGGRQGKGLPHGCGHVRGRHGQRRTVRLTRRCCTFRPVGKGRELDALADLQAFDIPDIVLPADPFDQHLGLVIA